MADITDVIRRIIIQAETLGMDQAASDIRNLAAATGSFALAGAQMGAALGVTETKVTSLGRRFETIANSVEPARIGIKSITRDLKDLDLIMAQRQKLNLSVTEVSRVRDLRVEQFDAAQRAVAEKAALTEIALQGRVDAAMAQYAAQRKARAQDVADFEIAQHAKANEEFMRRTAGVGAAPALTDPQAIADQEKIYRHMFSGLAAQDEAHITRLAEQTAELKKQEQEYAQLKRLASELRQQVTPQEEAGARHEQNVANFKKMLDLRLIGEKQYQAAVKQSQAVAAGQSKGVGQTAAAFQNLSFQINDVVSGLSMGQSPFTVFTQQAGQFYQVFQLLGEGGGATAGLKTTVNWLLKAATVGRVAFGGVAAAGLGVAYAMDQQAVAAKDFQNTVAGVGKGAGVTAGQLQNLSTETAKTGHVSLSAAQDLVNSYARAGVIGEENIGGLAKITKSFALTIGTDMDVAGKALAAAFRDPGKGIDALGDAIGGVDARTRQYVQTLSNVGKVEQAQAELRKVLEKNTIDAAQAMTPLRREWEDFWNIMSTGLSNVGKSMNQKLFPDLDAQIATITEAKRKADQNPFTPTYRRAGLVPDYDAELKALQKLKDEQTKTTAAAKELRQAQEDSKRANAVVEGLVPQIKAYRETEEAIENVSKALKNLQMQPGDFKGPARQALEGLKARRADQAAVPPELMDEAKREINYQTQIAQITALTDAERVRAAQMQSNAAAFDTNLTAQERLANEERAGNLVKTQSAAQTQQQTFVMQQQLSMAPELIEAAQMQGLEGVRVNAMLQAQIALMQQGKSTTDDYAKANIAAAGAQAVLATQLKDIAQATETRAASQDQLMVIGAETAAIGQNIVVRTRAASLSQSEAQARALERQGFNETAKAVRDYAGALADAKAQQAVSQAAQGIMQGQQTEMENLKLEIDLVGRSTRERIEATEALKAEQQIRAAGIPIYSAEAAAIRENANEIARLKTKVEEERKNPTASGKTYQFSIVDPIDIQRANAAYGQGNYEIHGYGDQSMGPVFRGKRYQGYAVPTAAYIEQQAEQKRTATTGLLQSNIGFASGALQKQMATLNAAQTRASDAESRASEIRSKIDAAEQKRQQTIQQAVAFGVSPTQPNADIYYDPVKRKLFAESIAQDTTAMLSVEEKAALAEAQAAKDQAAAAQTQIDLLQSQIDKLQDMSDLIGAGVELSGAELQDLKNLISVVRTELPISLVAAFDRKVQAATTAASTAAAKTGGTGGTGFGAGTAMAPTLDPYKPVATSIGGFAGVTTLGRFQHGGAFTVPGSSGGGDRPFRIDLTPGEHVAVTPSGARKQSGGSTNIENLIVQMPPGADPAVYLNKRSRPSLGRAVRNAARSM